MHYRRKNRGRYRADPPPRPGIRFGVDEFNAAVPNPVAVAGLSSAVVRRRPAHRRPRMSFRQPRPSGTTWLLASELGAVLVDGDALGA